MGRRAQQEGKGFEEVMKLACNHQQIRWHKMGVSGNWVKMYGRLQFRPDKNTSGTLDFALIDSETGKAAFVDCKSIDSDRFAFNMIDKDQLDFMRRYEDVVPCGYVICFRKSYTVTFFSFDQLEQVLPGEGLHCNDGLVLGNLTHFSLKKIFGHEIGTKKTLSFTKT